MIPINKVKSIIKNYEQLEKELASETSDKKLFVKKSKEYAHLSEVINDAKFFIKFEKEIKSLENIVNDKKSEDEMISLAKLEISKLTKKYENCQNKLKVFLLPKDEADHKNAIIEIRAGTGGLEATLFAYDLFRMYEKVSLKKNWGMEIISLSKSEAGGLKEAIILVKGPRVYSTMKFESGVHRVQRVQIGRAHV
mgnify:FL=1